MSLTLHQGEDKPDPVFSIVTEPGRPPTGIFAQLRYKHHLFEEPLIESFLAWDEASQNFYMLPVMERLQAKLRPILIAEDESAG